MRFTVERGALVAAVKLARIAVPTRPTSLPIIAHFVLTATPDGGLLVEATDMEIVAAAECPAVVDQPGRATAPAVLLAAMLAQCPAPRLVVTLDKSKLRLAGEGTRLALPTLDAVDWPDWSGGSAPVALGECDAAALKEAVGRVAFAASEETGRSLNGVFLEFGEGELRLSAADGYRCATTAIPVNRAGEGEREVALIPADALKKIVGALPDGPLAIERRGNLIGFTGATAHARARTIDGAFPDIRSLAAQNATNHEAILPRAELRDAARLAILAGDTGHSGGTKGRSIVRVNLALAGDTCAVSVDADAEAEVAIPLLPGGTGAPLRIGFDGGYLIDALGAIPTDAVVLRAQNNAQLIQLAPFGDGADDADTLQGIMPLVAGTK